MNRTTERDTHSARHAGRRGAPVWLVVLLLLLWPAASAAAESGEPVMGVTFSKTELELEPGAEAQIYAIPAAAGRVYWSVTDETVATVTVNPGSDLSATIRAVGPGRTEVMAIPEYGQSAACVITVSGITLTIESKVTKSCEVYTERRVVLDRNAYGAAEKVANWKWYSDNPQVATGKELPAGGGGSIQGIRPGRTTIYCAGDKYTAQCTVSVVLFPDVVSLSESVLILETGETGTLSTNSHAKPYDISWTVGLPDVASLSAESGGAVVVTALSPGNTVVRAQVGTGTAGECRITVSGVTLNKSALELNINGNATLLKNAYGTASSVEKWTWISSDPAIAEVTALYNGNGRVVAKKQGQCQITVSGGGYSQTCEVSVHIGTGPLAHGVLRSTEDGANLSWWFDNPRMISTAWCSLYNRYDQQIAFVSLPVKGTVQNRNITCSRPAWATIFTVDAKGRPVAEALSLDIMPPDDIPPLVMELQSTLTADLVNGVAAETASGTVTLVFDEMLFFRSGTLVMWVDRGPEISNDRNAEFISATGLAAESFNTRIHILEEDETRINVPTNLITLQFKKAHDNDSITITNKMCDQYGNTREEPLTLTLRIRTSYKGTDSHGNPIYGRNVRVEFTSAWDGRKS